MQPLASAEGAALDRSAVPCEAGAVQHRCVSQIAARLARAALLPLWGSALSGASKRAPRTTMNRRLRAGLRAEGSPEPPDEKKGRLDRSSQNNPRVAPRPDDDDIVSPRPDVSGPCPACPHRVTGGAPLGTPRGASTRRERRAKARVAAQHAVDATRERKTQTI